MEARELAASTIRRKLAAISAMFAYLCEANTVADNSVHGVARPKEGTNKGKTPALGAAQARKLLQAPPADTLKGKRDRAILGVLLYHAIRRDELCKLWIQGDRQSREDVPHLVVRGKGGKGGKVGSIELIDKNTHLFRGIRKGGQTCDRALTGDAIYNLIRFYGVQSGLTLDVDGLSPHVMRATAATNALTHEA